MGLTLSVKNFLSLRDVSITFNHLNVLIGPNASGKSNIIRSLDFISAFIRKGKVAIDALFSGRDFSDITFYGAGGSIEFKLKFRDARYTLKMEQGSFLEEIHQGEELIFKRVSSVDKEQIMYVDSSGSWRSVNNLNATRSIIGRISASTLQLSKQSGSTVLENIVDTLSSISVYSFDPEFIKARSYITMEPKLGRRGNNLAHLLFRYYVENKPIFKEIVDVFGMFAPDVTEIIPTVKGNIISLYLKEKYSDKPIESEFASSGYLKALAIITSLLEESMVIAYEEIENFVNPQLLEAVMYIIRKFGRIVIMTTFSPRILDYVEPENIILVHRINGETKVRKLTSPTEVDAIKNCLEKGKSFGDKWKECSNFNL